MWLRQERQNICLLYTSVYPMPLESAGKDDVYVGRIRKDLADEDVYKRQTLYFGCARARLVIFCRSCRSHIAGLRFLVALQAEDFGTDAVSYTHLVSELPKGVLRIML